jgi:hypothetical protein
MVAATVDTHPSVSLLVPCRAEYVSLCRLVAGALGAREALDEEVVGDLKMVVTEAFNCFLGPSGCHPGAAEATDDAVPTVQMDFAVNPGDWVITISNPDHTRRISVTPPSDPESESALALMIIEALVDSIERFDSDAEGSVLRLVKRISAAAQGVE